MDAFIFAEWLAYNSLEPLDPAGALLAGFSGKKQETVAAPPHRAKTWQEMYALMHRAATPRDERPIRVPPGSTPEIEYAKRQAAEFDTWD